MKALKFCANGCGVPPTPPSLVICQACKDKVARNLEEYLKELEEIDNPINVGDRGMKIDEWKRVSIKILAAVSSYFKPKELETIRDYITTATQEDIGKEIK